MEKGAVQVESKREFVRVLHITEYVGDREAIEQHLSCSLPANRLSEHKGTSKEFIIRTMVISAPVDEKIDGRPLWDSVIPETFTIMRRAVLPEDEGRDSYSRTAHSMEAAKEWIEAQRGEYFGPGDYFIMKKV